MLHSNQRLHWIPLINHTPLVIGNMLTLVEHRERNKLSALTFSWEFWSSNGSRSSQHFIVLPVVFFFLEHTPKVCVILYKNKPSRWCKSTKKTPTGAAKENQNKNTETKICKLKLQLHKLAHITERLCSYQSIFVSPYLADSIVWKAVEPEFCFLVCQQPAHNIHTPH
jgi:hypothetical protein